MNIFKTVIVNIENYDVFISQVLNSGMLLVYFF